MDKSTSCRMLERESDPPKRGLKERRKKSKLTHEKLQSPTRHQQFHAAKEPNLTPSLTSKRQSTSTGTIAGSCCAFRQRQLTGYTPYSIHWNPFCSVDRIPFLWFGGETLHFSNFPPNDSKSLRTTSPSNTFHGHGCCPPDRRTSSLVWWMISVRFLRWMK